MGQWHRCGDDTIVSSWGYLSGYQDCPWVPSRIIPSQHLQLFLWNVSSRVLGCWILAFNGRLYRWSAVRNRSGKNFNVGDKRTAEKKGHWFCSSPSTYQCNENIFYDTNDRFRGANNKHSSNTLLSKPWLCYRRNYRKVLSNRNWCLSNGTTEPMIGRFPFRDRSWSVGTFGQGGSQFFPCWDCHCCLIKYLQYLYLR